MSRLVPEREAPEFRTSEAPLVATLTAPPSFPPGAMTTLPEFTVMPPAKLLVPESVVTPGPFWEKLPGDERDSETSAAPELVAVSEERLSTPLPEITALPRVTAPADWEIPVRFKVPEFTETAPPASANALEATRVPPFTERPPEKLLDPKSFVLPED